MTSAGAQGRTLEEMTKTLHLPSPKLTHEGTGALTRQMRSVTGCELNAANAMFVAKDIPWRKEFLDITRRHYESQIFTADFLGQPDGARTSINGWVGKQTRNRIRDLIPQGSVQSDSKIVLVNAIYFKGLWNSPFSKNQTMKSDFFLTANNRTPTQMMFQSGPFLYGENKAVQVLGMPYKGGELMMVVVLPRERNGLATIEKDLTGRDFQNWLRQLANHPTVETYLPRFKLEQRLDMAETLSAMGMSELFTNQANLRAMANYRLKVDKVIHRAFLELQEEGTEAAAATVVAAVVGSPPGARFTEPPPRPVFRANHPFLFSIVDRRSDSILFLGRVSDPTR
jgi:serpin B